MERRGRSRAATRRRARRASPPRAPAKTVVSYGTAVFLLLRFSPRHVILLVCMPERREIYYLKEGMRMKKKFWIGILTAVLLLNLLPGMTPSAAADDTSSTVISTWCYGCGAFKNFQVIGFIPTPISSTPDPVLHWATIKCLTCGNGQQCSGGSTDNGGIFKHTGGTETPTCTTGKTCEKCGGEYGILGHI